MNDRSQTEAIDVDYVAHLARLELAPGEAEHFGEQLDQVLAYVRQLGELDVEGVEPTAHATPLANVLRADEPGESLERRPVLDNAPEARDGQFVVPRIIE